MPPKQRLDKITTLIEYLPEKIRRHAWSAAADATDAIRDLGDEIKRINAENEQLRAALARVRHVAAHPRNTQGLIRGFVYAADVLEAIDQEAD
jgi:hypothetical protein